MRNLLFIFLIINSFVPFVNAQSWTLKKDSEGIKVFTRPSKISMDEFKGVVTLTAKLETVAAVLRDVAANTQWVADCKDSKVLKKIDENNLYIYYVQYNPWPVDNRDAVIKVTTTMDFNVGKVIVKMQSTSETTHALCEDCVRMTLNGSYILEYIDREHTRVTYENASNPNGSISASLASSASVDLPFRTMQGLKKMVAQKKYIDAGALTNDKKLIEKAILEGKLKK